MQNVKLIILFSFLLFVSVALGNTKEKNNLVGGNNVIQSVQSQKSIIELFKKILNPVLSDSESMLDSAIVTKEDGTIERHLYTYTDQSYNSWATYLWQNWDGSTWNDFMSMTYSYDASGNFTGGYGQMWEDGLWKDYLKYSITYNAENLIIGSKSETSDGTNWTTVEQSTITYVGNTSIDISEGSYFGYTYKTKETTTYDTNDNTISELIEEDQGGTWVNSELITYEYNSDNNVTYEQSHYWGMDSEWQNEFSITYKYDSNKNRIEEEGKMWYGSDWGNDMKTSITFDSNNYMIMNLTSFWDGSDWDDYYKFSYNYTSDGNSFHGTSEAKDFGSEDWVATEGEFHFFDTKGWYTDYETHGQSYLFDGTEIDAYFATVTDVEKDDLTISDFTLSQNYPNPFNPSTTISFALPQQSSVKLVVYNSLGEEVAQLLNGSISAGFHSVNFNATNLSSGLYFYRISVAAVSSASRNFVEVKKMLLIK